MFSISLTQSPFVDSVDRITFFLKKKNDVSEAALLPPSVKEAPYLVAP